MAGRPFPPPPAPRSAPKLHSGNKEEDSAVGIPPAPSTACCRPYGGFGSHEKTMGDSDSNDLNTQTPFSHPVT